MRSSTHRARLLVCLCLCACASVFGAPSFLEEFSSGWKSRWTHSSDAKYTGRFVTETPKGVDDPALKVPEKAKHYGLVSPLGEPIDPSKGLVLQYELKLQDGLTCGGAYMKFLTATPDFEPDSLEDGTPYSIMFGPDKCGTTNKVHLILRHKAPNGTIEEKHLKSPPPVMLGSDTHVYTAVLTPDNKYQVLVDGEVKKEGSLLEDFDPPFNPPKEIDDPEDSKPEDWVDKAKIQDPDAAKPDDWDEDAPMLIDDPDASKPEGWMDDEPEEIPDPDAATPEDWDEEEDGEWEPPTIQNLKCTVGCGAWKPPQVTNPAYKGKWQAPLVDNPAYKGIWKPARIANPHFFEDATPLASIGSVAGVAIEIWTMDQDYFFDTILVDADPAVAEELRDSSWEPKKEAEEALKKEEAAKAAVEEEEAAGGFQPFAWLRSQLERPELSALAPHLLPGLDYVEGLPIGYGVGVLGLGAVLALLALRGCLRMFTGGPQRAPRVVVAEVATAKKDDVTGADDPVVGGPVVGGPVEGEIQEMEEVEPDEEEEEEGDAAAGTTRRRMRRVT